MQKIKPANNYANRQVHSSSTWNVSTGGLELNKSDLGVQLINHSLMQINVFVVFNK
jgi:hypothetical protein